MMIAITGTIGAGKSSVAKFFKDQGYPVFDTDQMVHAYYERGHALYAWLYQRYGDAILSDTQEIDRKKLASIVFEDASELDVLEQAVFPYVKREILTLKDKYKDEKIFVEVPLLFEAEFEDYFDTIIMVDAYKKHRHNRLLNKGFTMKDILAREKRQHGSHDKKKRSDIIINNNKDLDHLYKLLNTIESGEQL